MRTRITRTRARCSLPALSVLVLLLSLVLPLSGSAWGPGAWCASVNVSQSDVDSWGPAVALDKAGTIHVVWYDQILGSAGGDIYYVCQSTAGGWSSPHCLSGLTGTSSRPVIAVGPEGTVHVAWQDSISGQSEISYVCKPPDEEWTSVRNLSSTGGESKYPRIAIAGDGNAHVIWQESALGARSDIYHTCQNPSNVWTSPHNLSHSSGDSVSPVLVIDVLGTVHVCWQDLISGNWEIYYACLPVGGTWITPQHLSHSERDSQGVAIAASSSGALHVVWSENVTAELWGDSDVLYASRDPDGVWTPAPQNLSNRAGRSDLPVIAVDALGGIHVAWQDVKPPGWWDVYTVSRGSEGGWSDPQLISTFDGNAERPAILAGQEVDVVWAGGVQGNMEICHARRRSDGSWPSAVNISHNAGRSSSPTLACDNDGALYVVWEDDTPGHYDVHYADCSAYELVLPVVFGNCCVP